MGHGVASLLAIGCVALQATALESRSQAAVGKHGVRACSLLTRELVIQVTPYEKQTLDLVMQIASSEDAVGPTGSACEYGGIHLQIDPFAAPQRIEKELGKAWMPVRGVGDVAYFRDNRGEWAELYVRAGARVLTIQMDVPTGRTAASIQPNTIALANAILATLR